MFWSLRIHWAQAQQSLPTLNWVSPLEGSDLGADEKTVVTTDFYQKNNRLEPRCISFVENGSAEPRMKCDQEIRENLFEQQDIRSNILVNTEGQETETMSDTVKEQESTDDDHDKCALTRLYINNQQSSATGLKR